MKRKKCTYQPKANKKNQIYNISLEIKESTAKTKKDLNKLTKTPTFKLLQEIWNDDSNWVHTFTNKKGEEKTQKYDLFNEARLIAKYREKKKSCQQVIIVVVPKKYKK